MTKKDLRNEVLDKLKKIPAAEKKQAENFLYKELFAHPFWQKATLIGVTLSMGTEINTHPIIEKAWSEQKRVVVPIVLSKTQMIFTELTKHTTLKANKMGIKEPVEIEEISTDQIDLLIVPGVVYRPDGYRIGFGGGYYDRYLADFSGNTLSLALKIQIVANWQPDQYDIPVDVILTEMNHD